MVVGPLDVALFETRNGLKYPGFMAREKLLANTILLRVPVDSLLTTRDAYLSQIQKQTTFYLESSYKIPNSIQKRFQVIGKIASYSPICYSSIKKARNHDGIFYLETCPKKQIMQLCGLLNNLSTSKTNGFGKVSKEKEQRYKNSNNSS